MSNRKGFTLIELLIVVVIIGILAAIAIPKFAATKDKAKLAAIKSDLRNYETVQEAYFSDNGTYATLAQLNTSSGFTLSNPTTATGTDGTISASGYGLSITNSSIASTPNACHVDVGTSAATPADDGLIKCP